MVGRLRQRSSHSSSNHGTSYYSAEKLAVFGATHIACALEMSPARCKNQRADNHLAFAEGCKRQFALILPSGGRVASRPRLTVRRTKMFDKPRMTLKPPITASARSSSAQTSCRRVLCLLLHAHFRGQSSASPLQAHCALAHLRVHRSASPPSQETVHSTSCARDHREWLRVQRRRHSDCELQFRTDVHGIEMIVLRHVEIRRVTLLNSCPDGVRELGIGAFPGTTISCKAAVDWIDRCATWSCRARRIVCRAAMLGHGVNIAAVADRGSVDRPVSPLRMRVSSGRVARALGCRPAGVD
jgi:hypothetical protein